MNYQQALEFLRGYQVQNPVKYKSKYGDAMPEEAANKLAGIQPAPSGILGVKVEVKPESPKAVEMEFSSEPVNKVVETVKAEETPKKRGRKKNG